MPAFGEPTEEKKAMKKPEKKQRVRGESGESTHGRNPREEKFSRRKKWSTASNAAKISNEVKAKKYPLNLMTWRSWKPMM